MKHTHEWSLRGRDLSRPKDKFVWVCLDRDCNEERFTKTNDKPEEVQSAKVYVFDFHFSSDNKMDISRKKVELDLYFDQLRDQLEYDHNEEFGKVKCEVFLRKH